MGTIRRALAWAATATAFLAPAAFADEATCEAAWAAYRELQSTAVMDPSQYPLTTEGAAVRANCGRDALPVPPEADINPVLPRVRRPPPSPPPPGGSSGTPAPSRAPATSEPPGGATGMPRGSLIAPRPEPVKGTAD